MRARIVLAFAFALSASAAMAQSAVEEVVVTGSRITDYDAMTVPHVVLVKRADYLITKVRVVCDTRDPSQRNSELKSTLRNMIRAAASNPRISLAVGAEVITEFDESMLDRVIEPDTRQDTSVASVIVKTSVSKDDTFDGATGRITKFIKDTPLVGRSEILRDQRWDLTIVGPEQYRANLLKMIVADAKTTAEPFGTSYGIAVEGLQHPIEWYQSGPLDLSLFIRYNLNMAPLETR